MRKATESNVKLKITLSKKIFYFIYLRNFNANHIWVDQVAQVAMKTSPCFVVKNDVPHTHNLSSK